MRPTRGERVSEELLLREHGRRFLEVFSHLLVIVDVRGDIVWANSAWERKLGIREEDLQGRGYLDHLHPDDHERTLAVIQSGGLPEWEHFENRYRDRDGRYHTLSWTSSTDFETKLIYGVAKDVTELQHYQQELVESRSRLAEAQKVANLGSWEWDPETDQVIWSEQLYRIFGVEPGQFTPSYESYLEMVHPKDRQHMIDAVDRLLATGQSYSFDHRVVRGDREVRTLLCRGELDRTVEGGTRVVGTCQDVTEARRSERELARTASLHRATLESTADGILVVNREGRIVSFNRNFLEMWRIPDEIMAEGDDAEALTVAAEQLRDPAGFLARVAELYERDELEAFDVIEFKDGRVFERYCRPQRLEGEVVGRVWSFRDITARLQAERERITLETRLQQSQRLESLGRLAGGIAHDFNNHLVAILNYAGLAGEELAPGSPSRADLDEVIGAAERASALTNELVAFSRQEMVEPRPLDLNGLIAHAERLLRPTVGEDVELRVDLAPDLPAIEADPSQIERVLMNLVFNSREALPDGGTIVISTELRDREGGDYPGESIIRLSISDDGTGMGEDVASRALEPFFTTKPRGEGTGLGLATVYGIVNQAGGQMAIDSRPRQGTTVTIDLPASAERPEVTVPRPRPEPTIDRGGTVLVVEDEAPVRRLTARLLRDSGFRTLEASRGDEALAILEREAPTDLCLLLTDLVMPQMSGRELAVRAQAVRPELPVLFMSGYTDDVVVRHGVAADELPFLSKPFNRDSLLAAVNEAIEG